MKKILYIEDEQDQVELMQARLEKSGFGFVSAVDVPSGLEKAKSEKPDLILMDLYMPKQNGFDACKDLKSDDSTKDIPIIIITGSGVEYIESQVKNVGADMCIKKPYDGKFLIAQIKFLLGE